MLLSLTAFSQTDTTTKSKADTSKIVVFPVWMVKEVAKDLVRYDSVSSELQSEKSKNELLTLNSNLKDSLLAVKDSAIAGYKGRDSSYTRLSFLKDQKTETYKSGYESVKSLYIKEKKINKVYQIIIVILTTTNLVCLLSKH